MTGNATPQNGNLGTLGHVAHLANHLAHQLTGEDRAIAYQIKSSILSFLIVSGAADVKCIRPDNTVCLDILTDPQVCRRMHAPVSQLQSDAQVIVRRKGRSIRTVAPLSQCINANQLRSLKTLFPPRGKRAA